MPVRTVSALTLVLALSAAGAPADASPQFQPGAEQRQALQARWQAADADQDGYIDRAEAQALPPIAQRFDQLDADGDGKLTTEEMRGSLQDRLQAVDTDQDGYIDRSEAEAGLPRVARFFDRLDANSDGKLSTEEMQQARSRFSGRGRRGGWRR